MSVGKVIAAVEARIKPTSYELGKLRGGSTRWQTALHFVSGDETTVGWMTKRDGWSITEAGIEALEANPSPEGATRGASPPLPRY